MRAPIIVGLLASTLGCNAILGVTELTEGGIDAAPATDAAPAACAPNATRACYTGAAITENVGPCHGGTQTCQPDRTWGPCDGEVGPAAERCGNGVDDNCSGVVDENIDQDGDGFTTCAGDCCDSVECGHPALVNPGAYDVAANLVDDDCDGAVDNDPTCDDALASNAVAARDFARAIDLCRNAVAGDRAWGVRSAAWPLTDSVGTADLRGHAIRARFGTNLVPRAGAALGVLSTGVAADEDDVDPAYAANVSTDRMQTTPYPGDWFLANGSVLPVAPGCPATTSAATGFDPVWLTLQIRVPTNARSFALDTSFYTWEFPEYVCSTFPDFLVVLLDSTWSGAPANPPDKNLATYVDGQQRRWPVSVNLARLDAGLFTQCVNGPIGCLAGGGAPLTTCVGTDLLAGTGFETPDPGNCSPTSTAGGATGWLTIRGNVVGGETITLRVVMWDTGDGLLDSTAVLDHFRWSTETVAPGTVPG